MKTLLPGAVASFVLFGVLAAGAASAPAPAPVPAPKPPSDCVSAKDSADYVAGVDVKGRPVAPADLPGGAGVQIGTEIYAELRSANPKLRGAGVVANLPGLETKPPCPPHPSARTQH